MRLGIEDHFIQREEIVRRKEEVQVLERLGLSRVLASISTPTSKPTSGLQTEPFVSGCRLTNQKLSMLSRITGGMTLALDKLEKSPFSSSWVYFKNYLNISQPHSRYLTSPVILHM